jgi:hypothetical protein
MADKTLIGKIRSRDILTCPLFKSTIQRDLGYETAVQLIVLATKNGIEAADTFDGIGDQQKAENTELAKRLYSSAASSYENFIQTRIGSAVPRSSPPDVIQAAISRAEVLSKIVDIESNSQTKATAVSAAAYAAQLASRSSMQGRAYAILGNSAFNAGEYQIAIEAYNSASRSGFNAPWIKKDYSEAFRLRDNVVEPYIAKDYKALGSYRTLQPSTLRTLTYSPMQKSSIDPLQ